MQTTYVIHPQDGLKDKWVVEYSEDGEIKRKYFTARRRAVNSVLRLHPGDKAFMMVMDMEVNDGHTVSR